MQPGHVIRSRCRRYDFHCHDTQSPSQLFSDADDVGYHVVHDDDVPALAHKEDAAVTYLHGLLSQR